MMRFNYFRDSGAFERDSTTGIYRINYDKMRNAMLALSEKILRIQGNGDYSMAIKWIEEQGNIDDVLQKNLDRIGQSGIPRYIVFEQGVEYWDLLYSHILNKRITKSHNLYLLYLRREKSKSNIICVFGNDIYRFQYRNFYLQNSLFMHRYKASWHIYKTRIL